MIETPGEHQTPDDEPGWYLAYRRYRYDGPAWRRYAFEVAAAFLIALIIAVVLSSQ